MTRFRLILGSLLLLAAVLPAAATSGGRMPVGFQDDPSFRWRDDRAANLDLAASAGASIVRTTVYWSRVAAAKPANASRSVRPRLPLRGHRRARPERGAPRDDDAADDLGDAGLGERRSGREPRTDPDGRPPGIRQGGRVALLGPYAGFPFVGYYSIWNEPNLEQFLAPTFNGQGKPTSPAIYAQIAKAAIAGIKAGNPKALVAIGETSPRGRGATRGTGGSPGHALARNCSRDSSRRRARGSSSTPGHTIRTRRSVSGRRRRCGSRTST